MQDPIRPTVQLESLAAGEAVPADPELEKTLADYGLAYHNHDDRIMLAEPVELLDADRIRRGLGEGAAGLSDLEVFASIGSTNTWMLEQHQRDDWHGLVCLAERQVSGKGRRGRGWVSPFGKNIYMSLGWWMPRNIAGLSGLSLVVGMQVTRALHSMGITDTWLKWPNDIIMGRGKLAGILVELTAPVRGKIGVVIGTGVNLRLDPNEMIGVDQPWSTVAEQRNVSRNDLAARILDCLLPALARFEHGGFAVYQPEWDKFDLYRDREVVVHIGDNRITGIERGIDHEGNLLIETENGVETFSAGEVSLREG